MSNTLTWLHLSDLHLTALPKAKDWTVQSINQDIVIRSLLDAINKLLIKKGIQPDLIFITGDLAYSGKPDEYQVAEEFCNQLLTITGLSKQQLFIVPGNHDVDREKINKLLHGSLCIFETSDKIGEILSNQETQHILLRKLEAFYQFSKDYLELDCQLEQHYLFAKPIEIPNKSFTINLLGLNSALFAGYKDDDKQKLAFGTYQIKQALQLLTNETALTLALFHHPFSCFHPCEVSQLNQLKQRADLILTGHFHDPSNTDQRDSAGKTVIIGAGACYETRTSENSFNVGVLDLDMSNGKIQFYKYLDKDQQWTKNTDINLNEDDDGRFPFTIPSLPNRILTPTPQTNKSPTVCENFIASTEPAPALAFPPTSPIAPTALEQKIAILTVNPIDKQYDYSEQEKAFKRLKCTVDYFYLSYDTLHELDGYDYLIILSKIIKNKIVIEGDGLKSRTVPLKDLVDNIGNTNTKGLFIFLDQSVDLAQLNGLSLPTIVFPALSKSEIETFIFQAFTKLAITDDNKLFANREALQFEKLTSSYQEHRHKPLLPNSIDPKTTRNYVGRTTDLENICKKITDLRDQKNGFITVKGAGGIGKTHTIKKLAVALAERGFFTGGIDFVDCEFISDYKLFEFNVARTFNLEQAIDVKAHIQQYYEAKDGLLILDNAETLLHLPDADEIKAFLNFICDYVTVVVTSRELLGLDCEQPYELRRFSTDEALDLFIKEISKKLSEPDQKFLREEILETLLDNNPLAIKIITDNLPKGKDFAALKQELEADIFQKLTDADMAAFDSHADTNIERKKSLYASINFSYRYLSEDEKMIFELLSLFPDGIHMENLRHITKANSQEMRKGGNKEKIHHLCITEAIINALDKKSVIENNNGIIRLQSIVGKFAEQKLQQRDNMQKHYKNAFEYNQLLASIIRKLSTSHEQVALTGFNDQKNNFLKSIGYIDTFSYEKSKLLDYLEDIGTFFINICTNQNFINALRSKKSHFADDADEKLYFELISLCSRYFDGDFDRVFQQLNKILPKDEIEKRAYSDVGFVERRILITALSIYSMEGDAYFCAGIFEKINYVGDSYNGGLFYIGEYNQTLKSLADADFISFEIDFNCNTLNSEALDNYLKSLYEKQHIERTTCHYIKAKMGVIDKSLVKQLVMINPYTQGLQQLILAFAETDTEIATELYEKAIDNLKHIKYYCVEALFFFAQFLKKAGPVSRYEEIYQQGHALAQRHYFRFLIYKFEDLEEPKTIPYDPKNYPLPDNKNFDDYINFLIKKLQHQKKTH
ncbi:metallophosphoesterase [Methylovulum miyakonense]|uniref:metallophosphoesterase n=1 Tax=Methylovulum miyakonense TaxID=645578 RepID=UPI00037E35BB|nr:metallophosphoesterase [Methylovulum miyakonense]